jgi:hypothetical protein
MEVIVVSGAGRLVRLSCAVTLTVWHAVCPPTKPGCRVGVVVRSTKLKKTGLAPAIGGLIMVRVNYKRKFDKMFAEAETSEAENENGPIPVFLIFLESSSSDKRLRSIRDIQQLFFVKLGQRSILRSA